MKDKKQLKKARAKRLRRQDPNVSVSSDSQEMPEDVDGSSADEIQEKLKQVQNQFEEEDFDFYAGQQSDQDENVASEEAEEELEQADEFSALDDKLKNIRRKLQDLPSGHPLLQKFTAAYNLLIGYYFYKKKTLGQSVADHPVIKSLLRCKSLLPRSKNLEFVQQPAAAVEEQPLLNLEPLAEDQPTAGLREEKPAFITKEMLKNKGIPKRRSYAKKNLTPRMKQKKRYQQARHKLISKGVRLDDRSRPKIYEGETRGIKAGINKAVSLD